MQGIMASAGERSLQMIVERAVLIEQASGDLILQLGFAEYVDVGPSAICGAFQLFETLCAKKTAKPGAAEVLQTPEQVQVIGAERNREAFPSLPFFCQIGKVDCLVVLHRLPRVHRLSCLVVGIIMVLRRPLPNGMARDSLSHPP